MKAILTGLAVVVLAGALPDAAVALKKLSDCTLLEHPANDGDSFVVQAGEEQLHVRLYFVDCPESMVSTDADAKRVREQALHFGVTDVKKILEYGRKAAAFTREALAAPFTVHTTFAEAGGRSARTRVFAFVTTGDGHDLAALLVKNGLARTHGVRRESPDGTPAEEMQARLLDLEAQAMLNRAGLWAEADPGEIGRLRALQREETNAVKELRRRLSKQPPPPGSINVNTATSAELQSLPGIGPYLADAIIKGRPYRSVEELIRVRGIGPKRLEKIRPYVTVTGPSEPSETRPPE